MKHSRGFFKKVWPQHPPTWIFSGIAQLGNRKQKKKIHSSSDTHVMILPMPVWNFVLIGKLLPDQEIFALSGNKKCWLPNWDMKYQKTCLAQIYAWKKITFQQLSLIQEKIKTITVLNFLKKFWFKVKSKLCN